MTQETQFTDLREVKWELAIMLYPLKQNDGKNACRVYYPDGRAENTSREWLIESSLDTQWAHVFAPDSELFVVFSKDSDISSLVSASEYAQKELSADIICMCFGTRETSLDSGLSGFMKDGGIFLSSSGDTGGVVSFPSTSSFCISVGGSNLSLSPSGKRISSAAWTNGGGGKSDIFAAWCAVAA